MNPNHMMNDHVMLASPSVARPRCSGSSNIPGRLGCVSTCSVHLRPSSWHWQERVLSIVFLLAFVASPATVFAAPLTLRSDGSAGIGGLSSRGENSTSQNSNSTQNSGSIGMNIWLPVLLVTILFIIFSVLVCLRRCLVTNAGTARTVTAAPASANTTRPRRRPRRTPSQASTKSLPPYMKEPGDHELVLFRGPLEIEDDQISPHAIPALAEEDDVHPEMRDTTFDIALDRIESVATMADSSSTNLIRKVSESVTRPPELHHATMPHDHRRSVDAHSLGSAGSETELLPARQGGISVDSHAEPRGEAPSYTEAVLAMATVSLNDPEPNVSSRAVVPPSSAAGGGRSRFSFLRHNPFSSHNNASGAPSNVDQSLPSSHVQSGSALSRFPSHESHDSHRSPAPSRNHNLSRSQSRSSSNLFRAFHSPGLHAGSSTISLDSISAPLTHTLTRAEFHAPKGGLLTPEQIKLITSREALERFGMPYGPDAVAAFSLSRERLAETEPPPDFESVAGEHQEQPSAPESGTTEDAAQRPGTPTLEVTPSLSPTSQPSSHPPDVRADSRASTGMSYATAPEPDAKGNDAHAQAVEVYTPENEEGPDDPGTARPATPRTARPSSLSQDHGGHH